MKYFKVTLVNILIMLLNKQIFKYYSLLQQTTSGFLWISNYLIGV